MTSPGLFAELRRRRVLRTLALYILGAWGLMQVADVLLPALGLPEAAIGYFLFVAIGGFPVALIFGWFYDVTPQGIRRTAPRDADDNTPAEPLRAADYALLTALIAVLGGVVYGIGGGVVELPLPEVAQEPPRAARSDGPPMIGVLPFGFAGSGDDGEFFASGVHDDLLTRLAKIRGLRVVSRTSVLDYAGTSKKIPDIGRELGADAILEGGVRTAGGQIRVNAQLIDAHTDEHLWAETYDRELTASNIFAIQSEIARAIATALQTTLTESDSAELDLVPTSNMAAYRSYHEIMRWRETVHLDQGNRDAFVEGLEKAYTLDPGFTRPMVDAVGVLAIQLLGVKPADRDPELLARIESLIDRIGEVAPDSAEHLTAQSLYFYYVLRDYERASQLIARAHEKAPSDTRLLAIQSYIQRRQGDFRGWVQTGEKASRLDPNNDELKAKWAGRLMRTHRYDEAAVVLASVARPDGDVYRMRALLDLREHADLRRYRRDLEAIPRLSNPKEQMGVEEALLDALIAQRGYSEAEAIGAAMPDFEAGRPYPRNRIPSLLGLRLTLAILSGDADTRRALVQEIESLTEIPEPAPGEFPKPQQSLDLTLLALGRGDLETAESYASRGLRDISQDRAAWMGLRHYYCNLLGMAGAAEPAVVCLRSLLEEPSRNLRYLEPRLPYYDRVRDSAPFQALLQDASDRGWLNPTGLATARTDNPQRNKGNP